MAHTASPLKKIREFMEMIKFEHSIFALPFAYLGLILGAGGWPSAGKWLWVTLAMVSFRTMAMGANRLVDASIDARNPRTSGRALPAGRLTSRFVVLVCFVSLAIFLISAAALNPLCFLLTPVPLFLAWLYPFVKRFSWSAHFVLGTVLGIAPYGAWLAVRPEFSWVPGLFTLGVISWVAGFDIIYALQDREVDVEQGLHSVPSHFGEQKSLMLTRALHLIAVISWTLAGIQASLGWVYFAGLALAVLFLLREHTLIREFGIQKLQEAFFNMNATISLVIFAAVAVDLLTGRGA